MPEKERWCVRQGVPTIDGRSNDSVCDMIIVHVFQGYFIEDVIRDSCRSFQTFGIVIDPGGVGGVGVRNSHRFISILASYCIIVSLFGAPPLGHLDDWNRI